MRQFIRIVESAQQTWVTLYHGGAHPEPHDGMFFTADKDFASDYGIVYQYQVNLGQVFDTLDRASIETLLPLHDPYDGEEIQTWEDYEARSHDTWEMIEAAGVKRLPGDSIKLAEGGQITFLVHSKNNIRLIGPVQ